MALTYTTNLLVKNVGASHASICVYRRSALAVKMERDARFSYFSMHTSFYCGKFFFCCSIISRPTENLAKLCRMGMAAAMPILIGGMRIESGRHFPTRRTHGVCFWRFVWNSCAVVTQTSNQ